MRLIRVNIFAALLTMSSATFAVDLNVTHWPDGMYGVPFAVAKEKGFFKEAGLDVTGFIGSQGGGTSIRNTMASPIPYGEVSLPAAISAIRQGVKLTIVHAGVISLADQVWVTRKDAPINSIFDLKSKKLGYSAPKSVSDMVSTIALYGVGIFSQVDRKAVGGINSALTALREGAVDATYISEPLFSKEKDNYKVIFSSAQNVPRFTQSVGIVRTDYLEKHADQIRGIVVARRKGVEFIQKNPAEAARILAQAYKLDASITKSAIDHIVATPGTYWSAGKFDYEGMNAMVKAMILVGAMNNTAFDWKAVVDESYLPTDQRTKNGM